MLDKLYGKAFAFDKPVTHTDIGLTQDECPWGSAKCAAILLMYGDLYHYNEGPNEYDYDETWVDKKFVRIRYFFFYVKDDGEIDDVEGADSGSGYIPLDIFLKIVENNKRKGYYNFKWSSNENNK